MLTEIPYLISAVVGIIYRVRVIILGEKLFKEKVKTERAKRRYYYRMRKAKEIEVALLFGKILYDISSHK